MYRENEAAAIFSSLFALTAGRALCYLYRVKFTTDSLNG